MENKKRPGDIPEDLGVKLTLAFMIIQRYPVSMTVEDAKKLWRAATLEQRDRAVLAYEALVGKL